MGSEPFVPQPLRLENHASKVSKARLRLSQEEVTEAESGREPLHKASPSVFIRVGLELEDQQYALQSAFTVKTRSNIQKATLLERRIALLHQIKKWRELQVENLKPESIKWWLPSHLKDTNKCPSVLPASSTLRRTSDLHSFKTPSTTCAGRGMFVTG
ncbi:hypothetical protein BJ322DRAFT_1112579 [Thelephora terrestris]|uniref:Uncharacterized protein n=1 Tax=Thelephora terrestris TaxID=56493 RepID=A0A9P6H786_9AGAM|nr:hypothetical protein BJ322DRAFT_1112579 [Thelephora terrestris]